MLFLNKLSKSIDRFNAGLGKALAWLVLAMVLVQLSVVILRYVFSYGSIALQESVWYMHGLTFMLAVGVTYLTNDHVRIDVFYNSASEKTKAWINLLGIIFFVIPVCLSTFYFSFGYVTNAWVIREGSVELSGLPFIYLLKTAIWLFAFLLALQSISQAIKSVDTISGYEREMIK